MTDDELRVQLHAMVDAILARLDRFDEAAYLEAQAARTAQVHALIDQQLAENDAARQRLKRKD